MQQDNDIWQYVLGLNQSTVPTYGCEIRVLQVSYGKKWLLAISTSLRILAKYDANKQSFQKAFLPNAP